VKEGGKGSLNAITVVAQTFSNLPDTTLALVTPGVALCIIIGDVRSHIHSHREHATVTYMLTAHWTRWINSGEGLFIILRY
jgi:hypothetical protein